MPFAPHAGEELWESSGLGEPGVEPPWPQAGEWSRQPAREQQAVASPTNAGADAAKRLLDTSPEYEQFVTIADRVLCDDVPRRG